MFRRALILLLVTSVVSNSVQPHTWQPTRLLCPWDPPGKNLGVGCHFLLQCMKVKSESEVAQLCLTPRDSMDCSLPVSSVHGIFQARVLEWVAIAFSAAAAAAKSLQLCPTLRDPMDCSPPGSSAHGIFQARVLEWVASAFSDNGILLSHKKNELLQTPATWIDLGGIMLCEMSVRER